MIQIRAFRASDSEFIISLISRFSEFDLPAWRTTAEINRTNHTLLHQALEQPEPDAAIFIAEDEAGQPAGFIHLQTQTDYFSGEKHGYVSDLAVDQAFECQGVGRLLLETAEVWSRTKGYRLLSLYVFAGNTRAQRLYEKHGFAPELVKYVKQIT